MTHNRLALSIEPMPARAKDLLAAVNDAKATLWALYRVGFDGAELDQYAAKIEAARKHFKRSESGNRTD